MSRKKVKRPKNPGSRRTPGRNNHHLTPKSRNGKATPDNLLLINIDKHKEWHRIFGLMTLDEVIELLIRLRRIKKSQA